MAFIYVLTFTLLVIEMILFALISLPLPSTMRRPILKTLSIPFHSNQFKMIMKCIFVFISIMFVDSVYRSQKVNNELAGLTNEFNAGTSRAEVLSRKFYSQRNMYLCGFTLFLSLVLNRTYNLVFELLEIKETEKKLKSEGSKNTDSIDKKEKIKDLKNQRDVLLQKSKALSDEYNE